MKKTICILLVCVAVMIQFSSCVSNSGNQNNNQANEEVVRITEDMGGDGWLFSASVGNLTISGTGAMDSARPWYNVASSTQSIEVGYGITSVSDRAFESFRVLKTVKLPDTVTSIGKNSFYMCVALEQIDIPSGVVSIGNSAFSNCKSLKTVTIPDGVAGLGDNTFYNCSSLESITLPSGLKSIGSYAFHYCLNLKEINVPDGVTSIGENAFNSTAWYLNKPDGVVYAGSVAYKFKGTLTDLGITVNSGTKSIADGAFADHTGLEIINLPSTVTYIGTDAFRGCVSLKEVIFNGNATQWNSIMIADGNECLKSAAVTFVN